MWRVHVQQYPRVETWYRRARSQPSWVAKGALTLAAVVVVAPLILLTMAAIVVGLVAFIVLGLIASVVHAFRLAFGGGPGRTRSPMHRGDGRINVRVIED